MRFRLLTVAGVVLLLAGCRDSALPTGVAPIGGPERSSTPAATGSPSVVISQVYGGGGNSGAPFTNDFVELFNRSTMAISLEGWSLQYASATGSGNFGANASQLTELTGTLQSGQYLLVQQGGGAGNGASLPTPDVVDPTPIALSATAGKVVLVNTTASLGCNGGSAPCSAEQLARIVDLVGFGSASFYEGSGAAPAASNTTAVFRNGDGCTDTDDNAADLASGAPAPRTSRSPLNACPAGGIQPDDGPPAGGAACTAEYTPAYAIQGDGMASPLAGQTVTTQGVVVGDYEGSSPALRGFYLQDATGDADPATSDGIFVFHGNDDNVHPGDVVRVSGTAGEFQGQTQISNVTSVASCGTGVVTPVDITLPFSSADYLERYEGMLVRLPQTLTVTETFQLGRFGQVVMSSGGRLSQPTSVAAPGAPAQAVQASNDLNRIVIDDALNNQNPDPILFGRAGNPLSAGNTLRGGDTAAGITGVLTYTWAGNAASGNTYRVRPVNALGGGVPNFVAANPHSAAPAPVGGTLRAATLNLLNYFNTFGRTSCTGGVGGATMECRGADNAAEFDRQWQKTVAAILAIDADVLGVVEIENDGYGPESAIADLVGKLNARAGTGAYAFVDVDAATGETNALGDDAIKVGLIYQPARLKPVGTTAVLNTREFVTGGDAAPRNRPALAQAFEQPNRARFIISVNHLKSKGSACSAPDTGDGQANCSEVRTRAANLLRSWLASDPTGTLDPDVLIVGDLNSYAKEDPITALTSGGYTDLVAARIGPDAYSFAFDGAWGYLDYALASASLARQVSGITEWHINADEPTVLDYNTNFKSADQIASLYSSDPFRVSDHDPVVVGINLATPPVTYEFDGFFAPVANATENVAKAGRAIPVKFSLGGDRGLSVFDSGYPRSRQVTCDLSAGTRTLDETTTAGQSGLSYDASSGTYVYVWKTDPAWAGTCRELVVRLADESVHRARFRFSR